MDGSRCQTPVENLGQLPGPCGQVLPQQDADENLVRLQGLDRDRIPPEKEGTIL